MPNVKERRLHRAVATLWPFRGRAERPAAFERVHLPDEGQEFLKPPLAMLMQEVGDSADPIRQEAVAHFRDAGEKFKSRQYRDAAAFYLVSYDTWDNLSALLARGVALMTVSDLSEAASAFEAGRNLAQQRQEARFEAAFGVNLGQVCNDLGEPDRAVETLKNTQALCRETKNRELEALTLRHIGAVFFGKALYQEALICCDEAIQVSENIKDGSDRGHSLCNKGVFLASKGDLDKAEAVFKQGLALGQQLEDLYTLGRIYTNLASLYLTRGDVQEAISAIEHALHIHRSADYCHGEARNLGQRATIHIAQGESEEGHRMFDQAIEMDRKLEYRRGEVRELLTLANIQLQNDQPDEARHLFQMAHDLAGEMSLRHIQVETYATLVMLMKEVQVDEKVSMLEDAMKLSRPIHSPALEIQLSRYLGLLHASAGRSDEAHLCCQQAMIYSRDIDNFFEKTRSLMNLAYVQNRQGEKELAAENIGIAQAMFQSIGIKYELRRWRQMAQIRAV